MQQIEESGDVATAMPTTTVPSRTRRRRWRILVPVAASVMVTTLGLVSALGFGVGKFWADQTSVGELLERIALVAASSTDIPPADQVRDDQFVYIETYGGFAGVRFAADSAPPEVIPIQAHRRQVWLSVDGTRAGLLRDSRVSRGDPEDITLDPYGEASLNAPNFRYLTTLPTNPDLLLAKIYIETWGAGPNPQEEAFVTIGDLMRESIVPASLASALYRAAARIPGVRVVNDAVDALGRHGVAVARTHAGIRTEWIFDRDTLQFLGERSVTTEQTDFGPAGTVTGSTAIVVRAIVDRPGQLPPT